MIFLLFSYNVVYPYTKYSLTLRILVSLLVSTQYLKLPENYNLSFLFIWMLLIRAFTFLKQNLFLQYISQVWFHYILDHWECLCDLGSCNVVSQTGFFINRTEVCQRQATFKMQVNSFCLL